MKHSHHTGAGGPLAMLGASVCFATGGVLCKLVPWSPLAINGVRSLIAAAVVGLYLLLTHHRLRLNRYTFFGAACYMGVTTLFVAANKMTTAANAIILQYTAPIWIMVMMALFFHKRPGRAEILTMAAVIAGILCFFMDSLSAGGLAGNLVAVLSGVFYAGLFILNSFEQGDTLSALFFGQLASAVLLGPLAFRETDFGGTALAAILAMGLVQVGLAYILFSEGTARTGPVAAALINGVEPVLNPILVAVVFHEMLSPAALTGAVIVVAAILTYNLVQIRKNNKRI